MDYSCQAPLSMNTQARAIRWVAMLLQVIFPNQGIRNHMSPRCMQILNHLSHQKYRYQLSHSMTDIPYRPEAAGFNGMVDRAQLSYSAARW